jgi:hypothetical protein
MKVYYTGQDCGDGSLHVRFFDSRECIEELEERDPESFRGEGGGNFTVDGTITGISIETMDDVKTYLKDVFEDEE